MQSLHGGWHLSARVLSLAGILFAASATTGLGIAQCRRLVERNGGKFEIESNLGQGTIATFSLPKVIEAPPIDCGV